MNSSEISPAPQIVDWVGLELQLRRELARRVVSLQQGRVVEVILERSFGWGNYGFRVPKQATLAELLETKEENLTPVLQSLQDAWVVMVRRCPEFVEYRLIVQSDWWCLERRADVVALDDQLKSFNQVEQGLLLPADKSLREAAADVALEAVGKNSEVRFSLSPKKPVIENITSRRMPENKAVGSVLQAIQQAQPSSAEAAHSPDSTYVQRLNVNVSSKERNTFINVREEDVKSGAPGRDLDLESAIKVLIGDRDWERYARQWRDEISKFPDAVRTALGDVTYKRSRGVKPIKSMGQWLWFEYKLEVGRV